MTLFVSLIPRFLSTEKVSTDQFVVDLSMENVLHLNHVSNDIASLSNKNADIVLFPLMWTSKVNENDIDENECKCTFSILFELPDAISEQWWRWWRCVYWISFRYATNSFKCPKDMKADDRKCNWHRVGWDIRKL